VGRDAAIAVRLKQRFAAFRDAHWAAWKALEYDHDALADFDGLLRDAWSDTWALVEADTAEAAGRDAPDHDAPDLDAPDHGTAGRGPAGREVA
jgi:hypothetical protein